MPAIARIAELAEEFKAIRQYFHQYPELSGQEFETAEKIAQYLESWGIEVHRQFGGTGLVGVLKNGSSTKAVALRADMDALAVEEANQFAHASKNHGVMHACGHDGHITTLLLAARYLAETKNFDGTVYFVFQPAEENGQGADSMLDAGLMEKFPADYYFGLHNWPETPNQKIGINRQAIMASGNEFSIEIQGRGSHGALPNLSSDPVFAAVQVYNAIQGVVTRIKRPIDPAVMSICQIVAGTTYNVVPNTAKLVGTVRTFSHEVTVMMHKEMEKIAQAVAAGFGATATMNFIYQNPPVTNHPACVDMVAEAAVELFGEDILHDQEPVMPAEDFSKYLVRCPGAFFFVGNGKGEHRAEGHGEGPCALHNASYDFNDESLEKGASIFARIVEKYMA